MLGNLKPLLASGAITPADQKDAAIMGLLSLGAQYGQRGQPRLTPAAPPIDVGKAMGVYQNALQAAMQRGQIAKALKAETALKGMFSPGASSVLQGLPASIQPFIRNIGAVDPKTALTMAGSVLSKATTRPKISKIGPNEYGYIEGGKLVRIPMGEGGPSFPGSGFTTGAMNTLLQYKPKILAGTASTKELDMYNLAYDYVSKERTESRLDPATGATYNVRVPGMKLTGFPNPFGASDSDGESNGKVVGRGLPPKPTGEENKSLGFSDRMNVTSPILNTLEDEAEGDEIFLTQTQVMLGAVPGVGGYLQKSSMTSKQQQYLSAAMDWIRAKLRRDSGAAIGVDEFRTEYETYFPVPGDTQAVVEQKRQFRDVVTKGMEDAATGAKIYQDAVQKARGVKPPKVSKTPTLEELREAYGITGGKK